MPNSIPIYSLLKVSVIQSLVMATTVCIYIGTGENTGVDVSYRFLECLVFALLVSLGNVCFNVYRSKDPSRELLWHKVFFYMVSYVWCMAIGLLVRNVYSLATHQAWEGSEHPQRSNVLAFTSIGIINTLTLIIQGLVIAQFRKSKSELENMALKANLADASNILLRQQIQPHFLFNALTTIKSLYKQDPGQGEDYLMHLAGFLRGSLSNRTTQTVVVKTELDFCRNYIQMQSIRFGEALKCAIKISDHTLNYKYLPYFSLQPLIENVLKHNDFTEDRPICISMMEEEGYIVVSNNIQPGKLKPESTGNGLYNLSERYRLLDAEEICITTENNLFTVRLKILDK